MKVLYITLLIIIIDILTKVLVKGVSLPFVGIYFSGMTYGGSIPLIGDFLRLTYIENPGIAFGINIGGRFIVLSITFLASIGILVYLYLVRNESIGIRVSLSFILGGALGNLFNRIFFGILLGDVPLFYSNVVDFIVVDFIDVDFIDFQIFGYSMSRWPVFNLADVAIIMGVTILLVSSKSIYTNEQHKIMS